MSTTFPRLHGQFLDGYLTCAIWSSTDEQGRPMDDRFDTHSIDNPESAREDCEAFIEANQADLDLYMDRLDYGYEQAGHDFWLTRNHHGAGFWDRYYGEDQELVSALKRLTDASHAYGESYLFETSSGLEFS